jgi:hypothetical protein
MDPRDSFANSDSVLITDISFELTTPPGAPGGQVERMNLCIAKATGQWDVVLNTQTHLGLPFNQDITLKAELPFLAEQPPRIKWNVRELGLNIALGFGLTLTRIEGSLTASVQQITPRSPGFGCDGTPRAVAVRVFRVDALIHSTEDSVLWNVDRGDVPVVIAVHR